MVVLALSGLQSDYLQGLGIIAPAHFAAEQPLLAHDLHALDRGQSLGTRVCLFFSVAPAGRFFCCGGMGTSGFPTVIHNILSTYRDHEIALQFSIGVSLQWRVRSVNCPSPGAFIQRAFEPKRYHFRVLVWHLSHCDGRCECDNCIVNRWSYVLQLPVGSLLLWISSSALESWILIFCLQQGWKPAADSAKSPQRLPMRSGHQAA